MERMWGTGFPTVQNEALIGWCVRVKALPLHPVRTPTLHPVWTPTLQTVWTSTLWTPTQQTVWTPNQQTVWTLHPVDPHPADCMDPPPCGPPPCRLYGPPPSRLYGPPPCGPPPSRLYGPPPCGPPPSRLYGPTSTLYGTPTQQTTVMGPPTLWTPTQQDCMDPHPADCSPVRGRSRGGGGKFSSPPEEGEMRVFSEVSEDGRRRPVTWPCGGGLAIEGGGHSASPVLLREAGGSGGEQNNEQTSRKLAHSLNRSGRAAAVGSSLDLTGGRHLADGSDEDSFALAYPGCFTPSPRRCYMKRCEPPDCGAGGPERHAEQSVSFSQRGWTSTLSSALVLCESALLARCHQPISNAGWAATQTESLAERSVALLFLFLFLSDQRAGVWSLREGLITL
ncbi:unnamed protein product [Gadus morhua 'NCC']